MYSWPPQYPQYPQPTLLISNLQTWPTTYTQPQFLPTQQPPDPLSFYKLVPLQREPETLQTSPKMRIYDETNPNQFINQSEIF